MSGAQYWATGGGSKSKGPLALWGECQNEHFSKKNTCCVMVSNQTQQAKFLT